VFLIKKMQPIIKWMEKVDGIQTTLNFRKEKNNLRDK